MKSKSNDKKLALITRLRSSKPVAYKIRSVLLNIQERMNVDIIRIFSAMKEVFLYFQCFIFKNIYFIFTNLQENCKIIHENIINMQAFNITLEIYI